MEASWFLTQPCLTGCWKFKKKKKAAMDFKRDWVGPGLCIFCQAAPAFLLLELS